MVPIPISRLDHIGIRVTDLQTALEFYSVFGFTLDPSEDLHEHQACALIHQSGLRMNLLYNADSQAGHNILLDEAVKYPGITHIAVVIDDIQQTQRLLTQNGITVTEGPIRVSARRISAFVRDPDGNVLELNQLL